MPSLKWTDFIPHQPTVKQLAFLLLPHGEALFGGAAGGGKCLSPDHDVLVNGVGWVPIYEVRVGQFVASCDAVGVGSWEQVCAVHKYSYSGPMRVSSGGAEFLATPNHKWRSRWESGNDSRRSRSAKWRWVDAVELRPGMKLVAVGDGYHVESNGDEYSADEAELLGWWLSEGSGFINGRMRLSQTKVDGRERISYLCRKLGLDFLTYEREIRVLWRSQDEIERRFGSTAYNKKIPWGLLADLSRKRLLQGLLLGDGYPRRLGWEYSSSSWDLANGVQTLATLEGLRATLRERKVASDNPHWIVSAYPRTTWTLAKDSLGWENYSGQVYCLTIPTTGQFLVRRNGKIHVTGNSDGLLMGALQYVDIPGYAAIIFRKTLSDLKQPGALIDRSHQWLYSTTAKWVGGEHSWYFPTVDEHGKESHPAKLVFGYVGEQRGDASNVIRYQGIEVQYIGWDELTQHEESDYRYLFSRRRKLACPIHQVDAQGQPIYVENCPTCDRYRNLPLRVRSATNPGGTGALWVKRRFRIGPHIDQRLADQQGVEVKWVGRHPRRPFIPSFLEDNPYLDQVAYDEGLSQLDPVTRAQLRRGNWGISQDSRFKRTWARYYSQRGDYITLGPGGTGPEHHINTLQRIFCTVDPAGSAKESPGSTQIWRQAPSYTVISTWGLTVDYNLLWLDMVRFRREIPEIVDYLKVVFRRWRPIYFTIEANGLGRGIYQYAVRAGMPVKPISKTADKLVNATDAMIRLKEGKIWFPEQAAWLETAEDEVFTWTGHPHAESDDIIDTLSDAAKEISWEAAGMEQVGDPYLSDLTLQDLPHVISATIGGRQGFDPYQF